MSNSEQVLLGRKEFHLAWLGLHHLRRCLLGLGGLPCFLLRLHWETGEIEWWELIDDQRHLRPFDFEFRFGVASVRDDYHNNNLRRAAQTDRPVVASLFGFSDFYAPLFKDETCGLFFFAGQFGREVPTPSHIRKSWRALSQRDPVDTDPLFLRWVQVCLEVHLLAPEQVKGLRAISRILARLARDGSITKAQKDLQSLRSGLLAPFFVNHDWVRSTLDTEGLTRPPWGLDPHLDPRLVEELGLTLRPSLVVVLAPRPRDRHPDVVEQQVTGRRLQHYAELCCREIKSSIAAPLGQDRVLFALALEPQLRGNRRRKKFEEIVRRVQRRLSRQWGQKTVAGIGGEVVPGESLGTSYGQAAHALGIAIAQSANQVSYSDQLASSERPGRALLAQGQLVVDLLAAGKTDEAAAAARELSATVRHLHGSARNTCGPYLLWTVEQMVFHLVQEQSMSLVVGEQLALKFEEEISQSLGATALASVFESHTARLMTLGKHRHSADRDARMERATEWLERNLHLQEPLAAAARRAGLAPSSFRRAFRRTHGVTFAAWVRDARLHLARNLLCHGDLPIAQIAHRTGFGSTHTFIRQFRKQESMTPGMYRRRHLSGEDFLA